MKTKHLTAALACVALGAAAIWAGRERSKPSTSESHSPEPAQSHVLRHREGRHKGTPEASDRLVALLSQAKAQEDDNSDSAEIQGLLLQACSWRRSEFRAFLEQLVEAGFDPEVNGGYFGDLLLTYSLLDAPGALEICDRADQKLGYLSNTNFPYKIALNAAAFNPQLAVRWVEMHRGKFGEASERTLIEKIVKVTACHDPASAFQLVGQQPPEMIVGAANGIAESASSPEQRTAIWKHFKSSSDSMEPATRETVHRVLLEKIGAPENLVGNPGVLE